jgi:hypothetical protein
LKYGGDDGYSGEMIANQSRMLPARLEAVINGQQDWWYGFRMRVKKDRAVIARLNLKLHPDV